VGRARYHARRMSFSRRSIVACLPAGVALACTRSALPGPQAPELAGAAGKTVLIPLAAEGFDPTEVAVPWKILRAQGVRVVFATPEGAPGSADPRMLTGEGLGPFRERLRADARGREAYAELVKAPEFAAPQAYAALAGLEVEGLILPGGHAPGMKVYLESMVLQRFVARFFATGRPLGAICHGVVLAARSRDATGRSILHGRRTTALPRRMEHLAWVLTRRRVGDYYRTYPEYVEDEVTRALRAPEDYAVGPGGLRRDAPDDLGPGFVVEDGHYFSSRWPGDAHRFGLTMARRLARGGG